MPSDHCYPGVYRGVCVDPTDGEGLGRIRMVVPQVTGVRAVVTAWPCRPPSENGLPQPKQGVWVMYESGHPDKPVWIGVF